MRPRCMTSAFVALLVAGSSLPESRSSLAVSVACRAFDEMWSVQIADGSAATFAHTARGTEKTLHTLSQSEVAEVEESLKSSDFWTLRSHYPTNGLCADCLTCTVHAEHRSRSHTSEYSPNLFANFPVEPSERREVERLVSVATTALRAAGSGLEPPQIRWRE